MASPNQPPNSKKQGPQLQSLSLSSIQPIHDVNLHALSLRTTSKSLPINEKKDSALLGAGSKYTVVLSWYRSETTYICQNEPKHQHENPPVATLQCLCCKRSFCCKECFLHQWHHAQHRTENHSNDKDDKYETYQMIHLENKHVKSYSPTEDDIGRVLRVKAQLYDQAGSVSISKPIVVDTKPVLRFPNSSPQRFMIPYHNPSRNSCQFTMMSYNVLAEMYATKQMFPVCPSHFLDFNYRKKNLVREIISHRPDVLCLQEVQAEHFESFWYPELVQHGYNGLFKKKTKDVFTGAGKYSMDGCATFYKAAAFDLINSEDIEFRDLAMQKLQTQKANLQRMVKDNVALVLFLRPKRRFQPYQNQESPVFCVGNTHIMANPQYTDVKIWQVHAYLEKLHQLTKRENIPLVLAGDFNSTPDSGAYQLIVNNKLPSNHPDLQTKHSIPDMHWAHHLELRSAYGEYNKKSEPIFTTKTPSFQGTLDYLFFTPRYINLLGLLSLPELGPEETMPNERHSSDHMSLMCKFEIIPFQHHMSPYNTEYR